MHPEKETIGRILIAEFETRRKKERTLARATRVRLGVQIATSIGVVIVGILLVRSRVEFSGRDWIFLACTLLLISGWSQYRLREDIAELRAELDRLKATTDERKT